MGLGEQGTGLSAEQIDHGSICIRERQLLGIADIAVVGRQAPGRLFADGPDTIHNGIEQGLIGFHAVSQHQGGQQFSPLKVRSLIDNAVACTGEGKVLRSRQGRKHLLLCRLCPFAHQKRMLCIE